MFFYFIRPFICWKVQCLLDDHRLPGTFFLWLLKKDKISWQYYQRMLQLDARLQESAHLMEAETSFLSQLFHEKQLATQKHKKNQQRSHKPVHAPRGKWSHYAIAISALAVFLITCVVFFPRNDTSVTKPHVTAVPTPQTNPASDHLAKSNDARLFSGDDLDSVVAVTQSDDFPDYWVVSEQMVPSEVREVFRPALIPLQETYQAGKEQLLEDLGTLPLKPLTRWTKGFLIETASNETLSVDAASSPIDQQELSQNGIFRNLIDLEQIKSYWFSAEKTH